MAKLQLIDVDVTYRLFDAGERSFARSLLPGLDHGQRLDIVALDGVNLTLEPGSRIAVLGANSSGKTTLLRVMTGLLPPKRGKVIIDGRPGAVFSMGFGIDPEAGLGDLAYAHGLLMGLTPAAARAKVRQIMNFAGLDAMGDSRARVTPPGILSRLGIACVLCHDADIILLDEVLEQVDPVFHDLVETAITERLSKGGILVVVERSRDLLSRFCSEAILLSEGKLIAKAPLAETLRNSGATQTF